MSEEKNVTWAKGHIRVSTYAFEEGMKAAQDPAIKIDACPYHGWDNTHRQQRLDWCAGFASVRWPDKAKKKRVKQFDIEKDAGA